MIIGVIFLLAFIWWRWVYLPPAALDLQQVNIERANISHPLDKVIQEHTRFLQGSRALLRQFARSPETISLPTLRVDRCEVSQGQFRRFAHWRAIATQPPPAHRWQPQEWVYKSQTEDHKILGQLDTPAGGLSFFDAWAYCRASGGRLPSSEEFEAISAGTEKRLYPWGDHFNTSGGRYRDPVLNIPRACGNYPETATPEGVEDIGTSLLEWTTLGEQPVLMGGNAYHRPSRLQSLNLIRRSAPADFRSQFTGFRCVYEGLQTPVSQQPLPWGGNTGIVPIPAGKYTIGPHEKAKIPALLGHLQDNQAAALKEFPIEDSSIRLQVMRYEVTRQLYARFLLDPLVIAGFYNHPKQPQSISHKPENWQQQKQAPQHPVTRITWWSAWAFARWVGGRLPTANEWQALAGARLTRFPYGNDYRPQVAIDRHHDHAGGKTLEVTASRDQSLHAIFGLSGNVAEWTGTSILRGNAYTLIIKGGNFRLPAEGGQVNQSGEAPPNYSSDDVGFRVVFPETVKDPIR